MKLIALTGLKRSGKGEVGKMIAEEYPGVVRCIGFADQVKIAGARALGFCYDSTSAVAMMDEFKLGAGIQATFYDPFLEEVRVKHISGREYLQHLGTEVGRDMFGANFWVNQALPERTWPDLYPGVDCLVITDMRFDNEAQRVYDCGGENWLIDRHQNEATEDTHPSEAGVNVAFIDAWVYNYGGLDDLREAVKEQLSYA